jgi:hypothetical protein
MRLFSLEKESKMLAIIVKMISMFARNKRSFDHKWFNCDLANTTRKYPRTARRTIGEITSTE